MRAATMARQRGGVSQVSFQAGWGGVVVAGRSDGACMRGGILRAGGLLAREGMRDGARALALPALCPGVICFTAFGAALVGDALEVVTACGAPTAADTAVEAGAAGEPRDDRPDSDG